MINESGLNEKIKTLATKEEIKTLERKAELKGEQDKIVKLQTHEEETYFDNDGAKLYLTFQPLQYTLKRLGNNERIISWKSKDLLIKKLTTPTTTDTSLSPSINGTEIQRFSRFLFKI